MTKSSDLSRLMAELRAITVAHAQPRRIIELVRPLMAGLAPTRRGLITAAGFIKAGDTRYMKSAIMAWRFSRSRSPGRRDTSSHPDDSGLRQESGPHRRSRFDVDRGLEIPIVSSKELVR